MNKKNDKIIIIFGMMLVYILLSWCINGSMYESGNLVDLGKIRLGLYDIFPIIYSAFTYKLSDVIYILSIGGCYGVLKNTKNYRKLVDKTSKLIKGKEMFVVPVITLIMGLYVSISADIWALFLIVPFIISVFLRNGYDRLTAISVSFGGMFIGYLGQTFGTYGVSFLYDETGVGNTDWLWQKWVLFVIAFVLFNLFSIIHMKRNKQLEEKADIYCPLELDEKGIKKRKRAKSWPVAIILIISVVLVMLGHISWNDSFGTQLFTELHTSFQSAFKIADVPFFSSVIGSYMAGFGNWENLLIASFVILSATIIIALLDRVSLEDFTKDFGKGMKKISKVAFIYALAFSFLYLCSAYPWPTTLIGKLFGTNSFNVFTLLIGSILATIFCVDPTYAGYAYSSLLATSFASNIAASTVVWRLGSAIALLVGPTSFVLLAALSYADVPYTKWLKYIWKFALSFVLAALIFISVVVYM